MAEAAKLFPVDEDENTHAPESANDAARETRKGRAKAPALKSVSAEAAQGAAETSASEPTQRTADMLDAIRIAEAMVFAAEGPIDEGEIAKRIPDGLKVADVMEEVRADYRHRGVNLIRAGRKWTFRTASDLSWLLSKEMQQQKKLSRAALETLAIIAYHQPVTRAEIEDIRGVAISKGTLDVLMETGWVRLRGRRKAPGRPVTYGTTDDFLLHFGLESIGDLPGLDELKGAGLFDGRLPQGFGVPTPNDSAELSDDEEPLEEGDLLALNEDIPEIDSEAGAELVSETDMPSASPELSPALEAEGDVTGHSGHESVESGAESPEDAGENVDRTPDAPTEAIFEEPAADEQDGEPGKSDK